MFADQRGSHKVISSLPSKLSVLSNTSFFFLAINIVEVVGFAR